MVNDQFVTTRIENPELIKSLQVLCKGLLHETIEIDGSENLEELKQALQGLVRKTKARSAPIQDLALEKGKRHRIERQEKEGRSLSQIGTWEFDFTYNYLTWSPELYKLFEIQEPQSQKNLLEAYRERIHPDDRMTLDSVIAQSEKNCEKYDFEHRLVFERGRTKYIRGTGKVYKDEGGRDLRLVGTAQDISEERLARNLFRETEKLWKFALEGAGDGVWDWSIPDGHTFFSKHLEEMLGYAEGQMNPNVEELKKRLHPDDEARILADLGAHLAGERIYHNEHRILCKDGSYKWMLARGMIVSHGTNGDPLRMVGTYTDISRIKDAERKLVQASKLASLGEMAAGIAHEINNPLAIISGSIELLTKVASHPEKLANKIMVMEKSCERISRIVKGLKKFSRSSEKYVYRKISLAEIVRESMSLTEVKAQRSDTLVYTDIRTDAFILCDEVEIEQVIINLTSNAIDATKCAAEKWVKIEVLDDGPAVVLRVTDSGPGVPENIRCRMFEPFFTTKTVGEGTGLGLSITKGILDEHQATIAIAPNLRNTCFEVRFKKAEVSSAH